MAEHTTLGKLLLDRAIPEDMRDLGRVFDKKTATSFFQDLAQRHPDQYVTVLRQLSDISRIAATEYGGMASIRLRDLRLPPRTTEYRKQLRIRIQSIAEDPGLSTEEKQTKIVDTMHKAMPVIEKTLFKEFEGRDNAYAESVKRGWRGNPLQMMQLMFGDMLVADHRDRPVPIPGLHGYGEGVLPSEYWAGSYGSRKGYASVQFATAKTGFLGKQLAQMAQRVQITGNDCRSSGVGVLVDGSDPENIGSVLARTEAGVPAGTVIEKQNLPKLIGKKVLVRSLITCQQPEGVCRVCAGKRDQGKFPSLGSFIGIDAARVVSEPMTQELALSVKHTGGVSKQRTEDISGFDEINQFVQVPKNFRGAAVLAPRDGKVQQIAKAPQGGYYIHVGDQQIYVPADRDVSVHRGQTVEAGDVLTDGTPNPTEVAGYKGLGEGRVYFLNRFHQMLKDNGVPTHRRNVEALARPFFDRIRITNPDGVMGHRIGDVVLYSDLQRDYEPRSGSTEVVPKRGSGRYLERPVLHYTIGTRVTPGVVRTLDEQGVGRILVHDTEPGFEPEVIRVMDVPSTDPDWKVRLAGFGLQKSFLEAARMGSSSPRKSTSPVSAVMNPTQL